MAAERTQRTCAKVSVAAGLQDNFSGKELVAPFRIITPQGGGYFVKLVDAETGKTAVTMFAVGGVTQEVDVPLGTYRLKYAHGEVWCGAGSYFGESTQFGEADRTFEFVVEGDQVSGFTVELVPTANGNLRTRMIDAASF